MTTIAWKRGTSFLARCVYTPPVGALENLLGATITSQVRHNGHLVVDLQATLAEDGLSFELENVDGAELPLGSCLWDIRIAVGGAVIYTETITLNVADNVTRGGA